MVHTPEPVAPRERPWLGRLIRHRWSLLDVSIDEASRIGPHAASHVPAARVFCSMAVPTLVLSSVGRLDLVPWAIFGAFASIYGRDAVPTARVRVQVAVGISLVASIGLGRIVATSANAGWWSVVLGAAVAATAGFISTHRNWRPVGPLFQLIAFSVAAHTPPGSDSNIAPMAMAAGAVAFSVTIGAVIGRRPRNDDLSQLRLRAREDRPVAGVRVIEYGISAAAAGVVSTLAGYDYAYWAMLGAVVPFMAVERAHRLLRAVHRMTGTMLGLLVAAAISGLPPHRLHPLLLVLTLQAGAEVAVVPPYGNSFVLV